MMIDEPPDQAARMNLPRQFWTLVLPMVGLNLLLSWTLHSSGNKWFGLFWAVIAIVMIIRAMRRQRLEKIGATAQVRMFVVTDEEQDPDVIIPAGSRLAAPEGRVFETVRPAKYRLRTKLWCKLLRRPLPIYLDVPVREVPIEEQ